MLKKYLSDAISDGQPSVLLFISIDNFQQVRDTVGISGCDILINDIAGILQQNAINQELVCRFGAYSYAVLCKGKDRDAVEDNSARLLKMVEENISEIGNHSISATCSIGIYYIDENAPNSHNEIIARVERTLDQVQHRGGNRAQEYVPVAGEMTQEENDGEISRLVRSAVTSNTVKVYFQPIVCISGSGRECYEISRALVNREQQELAEADFIEAANRSGTAKALDRWTIAHAISLLQQAIMVDRNLDLVIRLSQDSLTDPELTRWIAERIQSVKVPGSPLVFAISESDAVSQLRAAKAVFKGLKQLHCKVILDEFGTGLNPFQLVKHLPADYLRINPAFVSGLTQNEENQQSIRSINEQAAEMDIQCIVPNVTDAGILTQLWSVGAAFVQGDFLQPPSDEMNYDFSSMAG
jgi:diguanylate cyclase (GGDEF)-like protein